jgi:phosphoadenosine phosphosulfate reductase
MSTRNFSPEPPSEWAGGSLTPATAEIAAARIAGASPLERLIALREVVPGKIVFTTSFGIEDQMIAHLIFGNKIDIEVSTLDTGRLFPSTYATWAKTEETYGVRIKSHHPDPRELTRLIADIGINGFYHSKEGRTACCNVRKVEPLNRALAGASAWVTGLRADQSSNRGKMALSSWDSSYALLKVSPLFDWTRAEIVAFTEAENVPVNPLHAQGFPSIGCEPCTRAIEPGEDERAGRWWWESDETKECGLHVDKDGKLVRARQAAA